MEWYEDSSGISKFRRRSRRIFQVLTSPSDLWLIFRMTCWAALLPVLKHLIPLKTLAPLLYSSSGKARDSVREIKIAKVVQWIYVFAYSKEKSCLQRSLLLYRYLSMNHSDPRLITGMKRDEENNWKGHAWVLVDGEPFGDFESNTAEYYSLMAFEKNGEMRKLSSGFPPN